MKSYMIKCDYQEFHPETYRGIVVNLYDLKHDIDVEVARFSSGNYAADKMLCQLWCEDTFQEARNNGEDEPEFFNTSSILNFEMDCKANS